MNKLQDSYNNIDRLKIWFFVAYILVVSFVSDQSLVYSYYIDVSKITLLVPLFVIVVLYLKKYKIDLIAILLFSRIVIYLLPLAYIVKRDGYWGNYFAVIASFVAYLIASQSHKVDISKRINNCMIVFLNILSVQAIYLAINIQREYGEISTGLSKFYMVTPAGASNYIASLILPLIVFVYYAQIKRGIKAFSILLGIGALFLIKSKNAILVLVIITFISVAARYIKKLGKIRNWKKWKKPVLIVTAVFFSAGIVASYFIIRYFLDKWSMGMTFDSSSIYETVNALSSDRLRVYGKWINIWLEHFFLGNGLSYDLGEMRAHNWIIELLAQSGIVGFGVFMTAILLWREKIKPFYNKNRLLKSSVFSIVIILFQGLAEVSIFTPSIDILFWFIIGLSISEVNYVKSEGSLQENVDEEERGI